MSQTHPRRRIWPFILLILALVIAAIVLLWQWDWFIPIVQSRASGAIGRRVTIAHLHVRLGRVTHIVADDVNVANPDGFATGPDHFAHVPHLAVDFGLFDFLFHGRTVIPAIALDHPDVNAIARENGENNYSLKFKKSSGGKPPEIGTLTIDGGTGHVVDPKFKSDFNLGFATRQATDGSGELTVDAKGRYNAQPLTARFVGGTLLSLRDAAHPYPVDLSAANGTTHVSLVGTVENPLNFAGARLKLKLAGADMADLYALSGVPIPPTPPYSIAGDLDYADKVFHFREIEGRVGSTDIGGEIDERLSGGKPDITMNLTSRHVDMLDLGGFIGAPPGKASAPGQTVAQEQAHKAAGAANGLLPTTKISLPKLNAANIHLDYRGEHIINKYIPIDDFVLKLDLENGQITVHPLNFGVGQGQIQSQIDLTPGADGVVHTQADIRFHNLDLARILAATHSFHGQGTLGGMATLDAHGNSVASMFAHGDGGLKLILLNGGNVSALLVDIAGLEFGNALLSAMGVPNRATVNCFVADYALQQGIANTQVFLLDTQEGRTSGKGTIDFRNQTLDYSLTTRSKSFSVGSLSGPINVTGPLNKPGILPGAEVAARAGAAAGLGVVLTPLGALLPTIQFGVGNDNACTKAVEVEKTPLPVATRVTRRASKHRG